jgi:hypothetical protein
MVSRETKSSSSLRNAKEARPIVLAVTADAGCDHDYVARRAFLTRVPPTTSIEMHQEATFMPYRSWDTWEYASKCLKQHDLGCDKLCSRLMETRRHCGCFFCVKILKHDSQHEIHPSM